MPNTRVWSYLIAALCIGQFANASEGHLGSELRLSPDSEMTYEEEYKLFEVEEEQGSSHLSREKRFIYLNVDTNMAVALLIAFPLSFVLPSMSNVFNKWRRKRSIEDASANTWKFQDDKVFTYFQLLDIPEPSCQLKAVCEFSADPQKYYPLSDVILRRIRNPDLPALVYLEGGANDKSHGNSSGFSSAYHQTTLNEIYNQAADEGQLHGFEKCQQRFASNCHYPIDKLLNMPVIRFWNALQSVLRLSFKDVAFK